MQNMHDPNDTIANVPYFLHQRGLFRADMAQIW